MTALIRVSISGLGRVELCPPSVVIGKTFGDGTHYATRGTSIHKFLYLVGTVGLESALELTDADFREECRVIEVDRLPAADPSSYAGEVTFALNWRKGTAREIGRGLDRDYKGLVDEENEIAGTADSVGLTDTHVIILDYKTGWADLGGPSNSLQLLGYALAAARAYNRDFAFVGFIRLRPDGSPYFDVVELGPMELDAAEDRIRAIMEAAHAVVPTEHFNVNEGKYCRFCPAFNNCPAKTRLAAALADPKTVEQSLPVLAVESIPKLLERIVAIRDLADRVEDGVKGFARKNPVPMPGGKVYGEVQVVEESPDVEKAAQYLEERFGKEIADAAVDIKPTMSWASVERAMRLYMKTEKGAGQKISVLNDAARKGMRLAKALKVSKYLAVKLHKPKALTEGSK